MRGRYRSPQGQQDIRSWCIDRLDEWQLAHDRIELHTSAGRTHIVLAGAGETLLIYLPGTNFNAATSRALVGELARGAQVAVPDLPGQPGLSDGRRPAGDRPTAYGSWLDEVVTQLRAGREATPVVLAGHSLGAAVALAAEPQDVAALVLINPAGLIRLRVPMSVLRTTLAWLVRPNDDRSRRLLHHLHHVDAIPDERLAEWMTLIARHTKPVGAPGALPASITSRWLGTPRFVISGQDDCFLPVQPLVTAARLALSTEVEVVPDAGHLCVEEQPRAVSDLVEHFLSGVLPRPG